MGIEDAIQAAVRSALKIELAGIEERLAKIESLAGAREGSEPLLSIADAARFLRVNPATVRGWIKQGLRTYGTPRIVRVSRGDLMAFLSTGQDEPDRDSDKVVNEIVKSL